MSFKEENEMSERTRKEMEEKMLEIKRHFEGLDISDIVEFCDGFIRPNRPYSSNFSPYSPSEIGDEFIIEIDDDYSKYQRRIGKSFIIRDEKMRNRYIEHANNSLRLSVYCSIIDYLQVRKITEQGEN